MNVYIECSHAVEGVVISPVMSGCGPTVRGVVSASLLGRKLVSVTSSECPPHWGRGGPL